ncbi:hypothetical protein KIPB_017304, partial [Kipferlia bialata]
QSAPKPGSQTQATTPGVAPQSARRSQSQRPSKGAARYLSPASTRTPTASSIPCQDILHIQRKQAVLQRCVICFAKCRLPYCLVEDDTWRDLMRTFACTDDTSLLPSRRELSRATLRMARATR